MPGAFLYDERVRDAVALTALTPAAAGMPAANLRDPQPRLRARFTGGAASILIDFGAATPVEAVPLISTNLTTSATARWRLGTLEALVDATPLVGLDFLAATPSAMTGWSGTRGGAGTGEATFFNAAGDLAIATGSEWRIAHDPATLTPPRAAGRAGAHQQFTQSARRRGRRRKPRHRADQLGQRRGQRHCCVDCRLWHRERHALRRPALYWNRPLRHRQRHRLVRDHHRHRHRERRQLRSLLLRQAGVGGRRRHRQAPSGDRRADQHRDVGAAALGEPGGPGHRAARCGTCGAGDDPLRWRHGCAYPALCGL